MRFRTGAKLDPSQVRDARGRSFGGIGPLGGIGAGGGVLGVIITIIVLLLNNGGSGNGLPLGSDPNAGLGRASNTELASQCKTGADANESRDCRIVGVVNSVQDYWSQTVQGYRPAKTTFFTGQINTGCGTATSAVGPFYCPADENVYIDLGF